MVRCFQLGERSPDCSPRLLRTQSRHRSATTNLKEHESKLPMTLQAVIFDLDGVITDTAEFHYLAWQRLADEEGIPFSREINEQLRGVPRRESLDIILGPDHSADETVRNQWIERKNDYYCQFLNQITPHHLLPNVSNLLEQLDAAQIPYGLGSASKNARTVLNALGLTERFAFIADGNSPVRPKPAPDLFRFVAVGLGLLPGKCLVIEDAASGILAAQRAGMPALAIGPAERFTPLLQNNQTYQSNDLVDIDIELLCQMVTPNQVWQVAQESFNAETQHHMETVFTLGNGTFSSRGVLEEGYPNESRTTFAHGVWDDMPVSFTELVNLPDWMETEIEINGQPFRLDTGEILSFNRRLDLQHGLLHRAVRWRSPQGDHIDLYFERFISYTERSLGLIRMLVSPVEQVSDVSVTCGINGHVSNLDLLHWHHLAQGENYLHSRTRHTGNEIVIAQKIEHNGSETICTNCPGHPRMTIQKQLEPGQTLQIDKTISLATYRESQQSGSALVASALKRLEPANYDRLRSDHITAWADIWADCDVIIEGDDEAQLAMRHSLFQLLVAAPQQDEWASIGAKTLSGYGYRGHVFWDCEIFVLPFFIYTRPQLARNMLMYRYNTLHGARKKAADNRFKGAQYAWESAANGEEVTPTWVPHFSDRTKLVRIWTGDIQIHISADIAYAIKQYWEVTGDDLFLIEYGAEIVLDTARFWGSRAEYEALENGKYRYAIRDVIGPDEYHEHVDNNTFTNRMCQWHLEFAIELLDWLESHAPAKKEALKRALRITDETVSHWRDVIEHILIHYDQKTKLMTQFDRFFERKFIDLKAYEDRTESMQVILGIEGANEAQVLKQADVVMLMCLHRDAYDRETWQVNYDTYMPRTDHSYGSSLSPSFHAWAAAEMNLVEEAYDHFMLAARADISNVRGNANDGIHAASAGGLWQAAVFGFAGLRLNSEGYTLTPRLPEHWTRLAFKIQHRGKSYQIEIKKEGEESC